MESPQSEPGLAPDIVETGPEDSSVVGDEAAGGGDQSWLLEIVDQLERDPEDCWYALEGLAAIEHDVRLALISALADLPDRPGARRLLFLLASADDSATRAAAHDALEKVVGRDSDFEGSHLDALESPANEHRGSPGLAVLVERGSGADSGLAGFGDQPRLVRSLVTAVDGSGRGMIGVSVSQGFERRTAVFLCDIGKGICDAMGEIEPESPSAGGLLDAIDPGFDSDCVRDSPELALGLLAGCLLLCEGSAPAHAREWLAKTLGTGFRGAAFPATVSGIDVSLTPRAEMPARARAVLDACPSWLDQSPLTFELSEEIWLREDKTAFEPVPERDAGVYRFLFEHRLIHRLESYRRMLLWMAGLWKCSGQTEMARSALSLAWQLSDDQYAVPSNPFTVELTKRSLMAAQAQLGTAADPRK